MKLRLFFLSIFLVCSEAVFSQIVDDTILENLGYEAMSICMKKGRFSWIDSQYYACIDSGIAVYPFWYFYHLKAMPSIKMADYEGFVRNSEIACEKNPKWNDYFAYVSFYHMRDYVLTLKLLRKLDAQTPNWADIVMNDNILSIYGLCYSEMGKLDSAIIFFDSIIETKLDGKSKFYPTLYDYSNRGVVHLKLNNNLLAKRDFESTIKMYSQSVEGHYYLALTKYHLKEDANEIETLLKIALKSYDKGLKNNHPYGEYVDLPNQIWRSDIMNLYYKIKGIKTYEESTKVPISY